VLQGLGSNEVPLQGHQKLNKRQAEQLQKQETELQKSQEKLASIFQVDEKTKMMHEVFPTAEAGSAEKAQKKQP
jgi:hypothetical protein